MSYNPYFDDRDYFEDEEIPEEFRARALAEKYRKQGAKQRIIRCTGLPLTEN